VELGTALVEPGVAKNQANQIRIFREDSQGQRVNVTDSYEITVIPGSLTVTEADLPETDG